MRSTSNRVYPNGTSSPSSRVALGGWSTFRLCVLVALVIILVFLVLREACKLAVVVFVVVVTVVDLDFANEKEDDEEAIIVVREDADGRPAEEEAEEARINLDDGAQSMILFFSFEFVCLRVKVLCAQRQVASFQKSSFAPKTLNNVES